jgi:hypothetical protein
LKLQKNKKFKQFIKIEVEVKNQVVKVKARVKVLMAEKFYLLSVGDSSIKKQSVIQFVI